MGTSPELEMQSALVTLLRAAPTLQAKVAQRVYDYVPDKESFPYVVLGNGNSSAWDTSNDFGREHLLTFHVWSRAEGKKETLEINQIIYDLIQNNATLALSGHNHVNMTFLLSDVVRETDGQGYHGVVQYRAITEEN